MESSARGRGSGDERGVGKVGRGGGFGGADGVGRRDAPVETHGMATRAREWSGRAVGVDGFVSVDSASGVEAPAYVIDPKNDRRGAGYDAFVGAEEFRAAADGIDSQKSAKTPAWREDAREGRRSVSARSKRRTSVCTRRMNRN